jgi:exodeoxyribonuclease V alpha subunit
VQKGGVGVDVRDVGIDDRPALWRAFDASARRTAEQAHPELGALQGAAVTARDVHARAAHARKERP